MDESTTQSKNQWLIWIIIAIFVILFGIMGLVFYGIGRGVAYISSFTQTAGIDLPFVYSEIQKGANLEATTQNGVKNFLILGTDAVANRGETVVLTDTMMLVSADLKTGNINMLSLPRDLWSEAFQTKINALYFYGQERNPESPEAFPTQVISEMTGVDIHHTIVISLDSLGELIDSVDGVPIMIEQGFTDTEFPRSDVDITSGNPDELYETVTFTQGEERMYSTRALQYIRSRKSADDEGTDVARGRRQQQVIQSLANEILSVDTFTNPQRLGALYQWYRERYETTLPLNELVASGLALGPNIQNITFNQHTLSIYPDDPDGTIEHPDTRLTRDIWVYQIRDEQAFKQEVQTKLGIL